MRVDQSRFHSLGAIALATASLFGFCASAATAQTPAPATATAQASGSSSDTSSPSPHHPRSGAPVADRATATTSRAPAASSGSTGGAMVATPATAEQTATPAATSTPPAATASTKNAGPPSAGGGGSASTATAPTTVAVAPTAAAVAPTAAATSTAAAPVAAGAATSQQSGTPGRDLKAPGGNKHETKTSGRKEPATTNLAPTTFASTASNSDSARPTNPATLPAPFNPTGSTTAGPSAPPPAATGLGTTGPVATGTVATEPVATQPAGTPPAATPAGVVPRAAQLATSSAPTPESHTTAPAAALQVPGAQPLSAGMDQAGPLLAPAQFPLPPAADRLPAEILSGSPALDHPADFGTVIASVVATASISEHAPKPVRAGHRRAGSQRPIPPVLPYADPSARTPLPAGGGATAAGSAGLGSAAPPVAPAFTALALALATVLLARLSLDLASCRSALLTSRLDRPG